MLMLLLLLPPLARSCTTAGDCSWNGECSASGVCMCRSAWKGESCETLNVVPGPRGLGYQHREADGQRVSSWGGAVMRDDDGVYHMLVSEMAAHAGMTPWPCNSRRTQSPAREPRQTSSGTPTPWEARVPARAARSRGAS